ncbi:MAG: sigma-54 dependent transcriptional regulator [Myxococcaceae bacterium]|nr:sigma-54 dependent transcriptional regulator [Myxococcaceae bacterium]
MTRGTRVLVVDDKAELAAALADELRARGFDAVALSDAVGALAEVSRGVHDALVTDLRMPGHDGLELLAESRRVAPEAPVLIMTAFSAVDTAVEAIRRGAHHYLTKPFGSDELALFLERALDEVKVRRESRALTRSLGASLPSIVGRSAAMQEVVQLVRRLADAEVPVLILGETGTGKGLVARALHAESRRAARPFVSVNCAALPEPLLESELFGHARGSFTGATSSRSGLFASAEGGTLFLDEVGELSLAMQAKLLAVLETGRYRAVGEDRERVADVRVISATHRDLSRTEAFRPDLRYRLEVVSLELPPLRARPGDLPQLVEHFLESSRERHPASPVRRLSASAMAVLAAHDWPGNVRELQHVVERAVILGGQEEAGPDALPRLVPSGGSPRTDFGDTLVPMRELQRRYAAFVLERCEGHKRRTCETLDLDLKTLNRLLEPPVT